MTGVRWWAAHLATLLLLATVGVVGAVAKPAPPPIPANTTGEDDFYYYYYYDYDYDEEVPRQLNLSEFHLPEEAGSGAPHVPRYMLELYADQNLRGVHSLPGADLIRSFTASTSERREDGDSGGMDSQDRTEGTERTRVHNLSFYVTLPRGERVVNATLRLYALITKDQYAYIGVERRVRLLIQVQQGFTIDDITPQGHVRSEAGEEGVAVVTVCEINVYERHNAWETFDVTSAVRYWISHPKAQQVLQIHIESVFPTVGDGGDMDVATAPLTDNEPLLLLYTSVRRRRQSRQELDLMISHEYDDEEELKKRRHRRSTENSRVRRNAAEQQEEESNVIWDGEVGGQSLPQYAHNSLGGRGRGRRGRRRRAKNGCKRKPLKVDFKDIGWNKWIIAPPSYEAHQCSGKCFYPLASHLSPTKHAVVQNLVHSLHPDRTSRACCVPTLLGPISLLYIENGITTYKYDYDDMVVLECGCR